jgi:Ser/Thr protein kinase RdoA (MazF antagonist)
MQNHPKLTQFSGLEKLGQEALKACGMVDAELKPIAYRENMTFGVDAGARGKFALRVHQEGYRSDAQVQSELDFMEHVTAAGVRTPKVIWAESGASFVYAEHAAADMPRQCDIFEWIDGKPFRRLAEPPEMSVEDAVDVYAR